MGLSRLLWGQAAQSNPSAGDSTDTTCPQGAGDITLEPPHTAVPQFPPGPATHPAEGWVPKGSDPTARKERG